MADYTRDRRRTTELLGVYAWQIGYERRVVRVGGALSGMILFTDDRGNSLTATGQVTVI